MVSKKKTRSFYKGTVKNGTHLSSSDSKMTSKVNKMAVPRLKKMNIHCYSLKIDDGALFKNSSKRTASVLRLLKSMLNSEVDRLSLQQLEYEMDCTDYPVNTMFLN